MTQLKRTAFLFFLGWMIFQPHYGQQKTITLDEAIDLARTQSYFSAHEKRNYDISKINYELYKISRLPNASLSLTPLEYSRSVEKTDYEGNIQKRTVKDFKNYGGIEISQPLTFIGGEIYMQSEITRRQFQRNDEGKIENYFSTPFYLGYNYSFGSINNYKWDKKLFPMQYEISQREFISNNFDIAIKTVGLFANLLIADTKLKLSTQNIARYDSLYKLGSNSNINQIDLKKLLYNIKEEEYNQQEFLLKRKEAERELKNYLNLPIETELKCIIPSQINSKLFTEAFVLEKMKKNNADLLILDKEIVETEKYLQIAKAKRHDISFQFQVGLNGSNENFAGAYNPLNNNQIYRVGLEIPILNWGENRKQIKQAQIRLEDANEFKEYQSKNIENRLLTLIQGYNNQYNQVLKSKDLDALASSLLSDAESQFLKNNINSVSLTILTNDKNRALLEYIYDIMAYYKYQYSISKLCLYDFIEDKDLLNY